MEQINKMSTLISIQAIIKLSRDSTLDMGEDEERGDDNVFLLIFNQRMRMYCIYNHTWPEAVIVIFAEGFPLADPKLSIVFTSCIPSTTSPKTTCLPSSQSHVTVVMKNCEPLVPGPALAMERSPALSCFFLKFSSANLAP